MPKFDIIITVWNRLGYTKRTIASLINSGAVDDCERLIIVDNRSTEEGMDEFLHDMYANMPAVSGKVWLLRRGKNDGWGIAVNDALGLSRSELLFLVNNDVEFKTDFHKEMIDISRGVELTVKEFGILAGWKHKAHTILNRYKRFVEMDNVPAVCWLLSKSAMMKVGMLPENGPCMTKGGNGEDTGYVIKMQEAGFFVGATEEDLATHIDGY